MPGQDPDACYVRRRRALLAILLAISRSSRASHGILQPRDAQLDAYQGALQRGPDTGGSSLTRKRSLVQSQYRPPVQRMKLNYVFDLYCV
jgi:hypothetical protein